MSTVKVTGTILDQVSNPLPGAICNVKLNRTDIDGSYITPQEKRFIADANGHVEMDLWPNNRGVTESMYSIEVSSPVTGERVLRTNFVVYDEDSLGNPITTVDIIDVAEIPPYPGKNESQVAIELLASEKHAIEQYKTDAEQAATNALQYKGDAEAAAIQTAADRVQTGNDVVTATQQADIAATKAAEALASQQAASLSETNASQHKDDAETAAASAAASAASNDPLNIVHKPGSGLDNEAGTAYASDVTTSPTDTTAGRLLKVGDFGLGVPLFTTPSNGALSNSYQKIAEINLNTRYTNCQINLTAVAVYNGLSSVNTFDVEVRVKQQNAFGEDPFVDVVNTTKGSVNYMLSVGYVIEQNSPTSIVSIYVRNRRTYNSFSIYEQAVANREFLTYFFNEPRLTTAPVNYIEKNGSKDFWQGNILGTVSQSGGVPTGAIIERGSNANGEYVKYADGTMICTHNLFNSTTSPIWTFPAVFSTVDAVLTNVNTSADYRSTCAFITTTQTNYYVRDASGTLQAGRYTLLFAIGRWY